MKAKDNPFGSDHVTSLPFIFEFDAETTPEAAWRRLEAMNWHGAIVGPCGSGKTTLLEAVERRLKARGLNVVFWRLNTGHTQMPRGWWQIVPGANDALLVDGVEQLRPWDWQRLRRHARRAGAFVITSHRPTSLPLWLETSTSPALLQQLVTDLGVTLNEEDAQTLWREVGGNVRLALWHLYDQHADCEAELKISP